MNHHLTMVLVLLWPLLLAVALFHPRSRLLALRLSPWAAAPALFVALGLEDAILELPGTLLGSSLRLEPGGRPFLILASVLSLSAGLLAHERIGDSGTGSHFALFLLLAISGLLGLALASDALLFLTASTLLGYSLYGMHAAGSISARATGRIFVVLLVLSDLALFDLLLMVSHDAGGLSFGILRHTLLVAELPGGTLALLLLGLGVKVGLIGVHLWLGPLFVTTAAPVRPLVLGFVFCAGMLGWLRLLPLGEVFWPDAQVVLYILSLLGLIYAVIVGMAQVQLRALLACGVMGLGALFFWLLGAVLGEPTLWPELFVPMHDSLMLAGLALAVLFLLPGRIGDSNSAGLRRGFAAAGAVAVLMLAATPLGLIATLTPISSAKAMSLTGIGTAFALLAGRALHLHSTAPITPERVLAVAGVSFAVLLAAASDLFTLPLGAIWRPALLLLFAAVLGWLAGDALSRHMPLPPPGYLAAPLDRVVTHVIDAVMHRIDLRLSRSRKGARYLLYELQEELALERLADRLESLLRRWPVAMFILVVLGMILVWLGWFG